MINIYAHTYMIATRTDHGTVMDAPASGTGGTRLKRFLSRYKRRRWDAPAHWVGVDRS